ncbi:MAG: ferrochelatase [Thermoanaerobaculia bacterium]|nr:ferrochelatase [Thermoanaerobaculia bacterium]
MARTGLLLLNLGTPDSTEVADVRRYLKEFLSDPRVLDVPALKRWLVLRLFILPFRPKQSAEAYRQIWTDRGSPLLFHTQDLAGKVQNRLGDRVLVEVAMRYQNPSIGRALDRLRGEGVDDIVVFPLFPQYSSSAWGSAVEEVFELAGRRWNVPFLRVVPPFYDHPSFLDACADVARPHLADLEPEYSIMSFHGLPERQVIKSDESGGSHCLRSEDCCESICNANRHCYRAQCFATARGIAARLGLGADDYEVTFQSRLGRDPWIRPYTDVRIVELAEKGVKRLAVFSPAFVADCLETLEEIGMRAKEDFESRGGERLELVPSLNSDDRWVTALLDILDEPTAPSIAAS